MLKSLDNKDSHIYYVEEEINDKGTSTYHVFLEQEDTIPKWSIEGCTRLTSLFKFIR